MKIGELRSEYQRIRERLKAEAKGDGLAASHARLMLLTMPPFIDFMMGERRARVPRDLTMEAVFNVAADLTHKGIVTNVTILDRNRALDVALDHINAQVRPMLARTPAGILLPTERE
jgi:hypothetical protein